MSGRLGVLCWLFQVRSDQIISIASNHIKSNRIPTGRGRCGSWSRSVHVTSNRRPRTNSISFHFLSLPSLSHITTLHIPGLETNSIHQSIKHQEFFHRIESNRNRNQIKSTQSNQSMKPREKKEERKKERKRKRKRGRNRKQESAWRLFLTRDISLFLFSFLTPHWHYEFF